MLWDCTRPFMKQEDGAGAALTQSKQVCIVDSDITLNEATNTHWVEAVLLEST